MYIKSVKEWHRFWQKKRDSVPVACLYFSLISEPLFGRVFSPYEFFDRVLRKYSGMLIVWDKDGVWIVSRQYMGYFVITDKIETILKSACDNTDSDIQLILDTVINSFVKEV